MVKSMTNSEVEDSQADAAEDDSEDDVEDPTSTDSADTNGKKSPVQKLDKPRGM